MKIQANSFLKLALTLSFLSISAEAASVPIGHNTIFSGRINRSTTNAIITLVKGPALVGQHTVGTSGPITTGMNFNPDNIVEYMAMSKSIKQSEIRIKIPLIDYGYTGTLNNACIKLRGKKNEIYETKKLGRISHCIGTVTIEKYTRFELKGTYSGGLTNLEYKPEYPKSNSQVNNGFATGIPTNFPPVAGSIKGFFYILDPWRHDPRFGVNTDSVVDAVENDLKRMAAEFGIDVNTDDVFDNVRSNQRRNNNTSSQGGNIDACDCSCNYVSNATASCKLQCGEVFSACTAAPYQPAEETVLNQRDANTLSPDLVLPKVKGPKLQGIDQAFVDQLEKGDVQTPDDLRTKFIARLQKNHPGEAKAPIREMMIKGFDSMPDEKAKLIMFKSIDE